MTFGSHRPQTQSPGIPAENKATEEKKGTKHLKPISEYFVNAQTLPLTGFPTAVGVSRCLATFSLPTIVKYLLSSLGFKMFRTVAGSPEQPKSLRKLKLGTTVLA